MAIRRKIPTLRFAKFQDELLDHLFLGDDYMESLSTQGRTWYVGGRFLLESGRHDVIFMSLRLIFSDVRSSEVDSFNTPLKFNISMQKTFSIFEAGDTFSKSSFSLSTRQISGR